MKKQVSLNFYPDENLSNSLCQIAVIDTIDDVSQSLFFFDVRIGRFHELEVPSMQIKSSYGLCNSFTLTSEIIDTDNLLSEGFKNRRAYNAVWHEFVAELKTLGFPIPKKNKSYLSILNRVISYDLLHESNKKVPFVDKMELVKHMLYIYSPPTVINFIKKEMPLF